MQSSNGELKMTPEAQRIAINEACGWQGPHHPENIDGMIGWSSRYRGIWWVTPDKNRVLISDVPDPLNDLNAIHEAERTVGLHGEDFRGRKLRRTWATYTALCDPRFLTAAQLSLALLLSIK